MEGKSWQKTNTYVTGWNLEEDVLKGYLKEFKKKKDAMEVLKKMMKTIVVLNYIFKETKFMML